MNLAHAARSGPRALGRPGTDRAKPQARVRAVSDRSSDYDYDYPPQAVAQVPAARRDAARLLLVPRAAATSLAAPPERGATAAAPTHSFAERRVADLPELLQPGDLLVLNDTHVLPARLVARRVSSGGRVSVLVLEPRGREATVLLGARGTLLVGERLAVAGDTWMLRAALGEGRYVIAVEAGRDVRALLAEVGRMPLPPYIERGAEADPRDALDRERYQTVFAGASASVPAGLASAADAKASTAHVSSADAVAAPTAGLHFTPELLAALVARGVCVARLRLDVGEGTFRPLRGESLDEHVMHREHYEIPKALAASFAETRAAGGRVVAVGTTVVRALESAVTSDGSGLRAGPASTEIFLRPGHDFRAIDALLTNFHQPRSTLLVLVSALAGRDTIRAAYAHALAQGFRFFSYGDAMLIA